MGFRGLYITFLSKKFSRVLAGARYQQELTNYLKWLQGQSDRQPNIGKKGNRAASQTLYVKPFSYALPETVLLQVSGSQAAWTTYETAFAGRTVATLPTGDTGLKIRNVKAARVNIITGRATTGTVATSHITAAKYLNYGGKAVSVPFGATSGGTDTEEAAFAAIKGNAELANFRVYLIPEVV